MYKNKKAMSEIISFVLITLLIVIFSTITYLFAKDVINERVNEVDLKNMNTFFKKMNFQTTEIQNFDEESYSIPINFRSGVLIFIDNHVKYQSQVSFEGNSYCFEDLCHESINEYELIYYNLSNGYTYDKEFMLYPGNYMLFLKNSKNESEIQITIK